MLEKLREITYFAPDIDAYWIWLQAVLNAQLERRFDNLIQCRLGDMLVTLHPCDDKGPTGPGGQVAYWAVTNVEEAVSHFEKNGGYRFRGPIQGVDGPWVAQVQDPWGNVWGLCQVH